MLSISQVAAASGAEAGTIRAWMNRYAFWFDAFGGPGKYRWSLADVLTAAIIQELSSKYGCEPPALVDRINMVAKAIREFVDKFKPLDSDKPLPGPWLILWEDRAELYESPEEAAAAWRALWNLYPDPKAGKLDESFVQINICAILARIRHNLYVAGADVE